MGRLGKAIPEDLLKRLPREGLFETLRLGKHQANIFLDTFLFYVLKFILLTVKQKQNNSLISSTPPTLLLTVSSLACVIYELVL